jgi:DNA helicase-4
MIELAAAEAELQEAVERAGKEFRFQPDQALLVRINLLSERQRAASAKLQKAARRHADRVALPNSKFWLKEHEAYLKARMPVADKELEELRDLTTRQRELAFQSFLAGRVRDLEARVASAKARRRLTRNAVIAAFKETLKDSYLASEDDRFVDPIDADVSAHLCGLRRRHIGKWAKTCLNGLSVDDEQADAIGAVGRHVKLTARAGSGKTRTLTARAAFLIDGCRVDAREVLLLAFNRKAAAEMATRLQGFGIRCPQVLTFHALARAIVRPDERILVDDDRDPEKAGRITQIIQRWIETDLGDHRVRDVMLRYCRADWEKIMFASSVTDKGLALKNLRASVLNETLDGKQVKSFGEKVIANFLFEHDVAYRYEPLHRWNGNVYRPDFEVLGRKLVIEYFGMSADAGYRKQMDAKREFWRSRGWTLLDYEPAKMRGDVGNALPMALESDLRRLKVPLRRRSDEELWAARGRQLRLDMSRLISQLVGRCRKAMLSPDDFVARVSRHSAVDPIEADVLAIVSDAYAAYLENLIDDGEEDFDGLLQRAIAMVRSGTWEFGRRDLNGDLRRIRHVLVDEFQDVSPLFWELIQEVRRQGGKDVTIFGVGDDWQAINGFAGSTTRFLQDFETLLQPATALGLLTNYRSTRSVIDVGNAIMAGQGPPARAASRAGAGQVLIADLAGFEPSCLESHHWRGDCVTPALRRLIAGPISEGKSVAVLARQRFPPYPIAERTVGRAEGPMDAPSDLGRLRRLVCEGMNDVARERVMFDTVHAFKGREADFVIVLDAVEGRFPKLHPNWVFGRIFGDTFESLVEDERRLFYVACSRAASTLVILTDGSRKCGFLGRVEATSESLWWGSLPPACPRDGDWMMVIDCADGEGSDPTYQRRDALKERGFCYADTGGKAVWYRRVSGDHGIEELAMKFKAASWFPGPPGLRIRLFHGDGALAAEYVLVRATGGGDGLRVESRPGRRKSSGPLGAPPS